MASRNARAHIDFDVAELTASNSRANATADITKRERELVDEFKKKGLTIIDPDKKSFQDAIVKSVPLESMGYTKADWEKVQAVK